MPVHFVMWCCLGTHRWHLVFTVNPSLVKTHTAYGGWVGRRGKSCSLPTEIKFLCVFLVRRVVMNFGTSLFDIGYNSTPLLSNTPPFEPCYWHFILHDLAVTQYTLLSSSCYADYPCTFLVLRCCRQKYSVSYNNIYLLQLGCYPVSAVILHVYKTWNWLLLNLSRQGYMRSMYWQLGILGTVSAFAFRHRETK